MADIAAPFEVERVRLVNEHPVMDKVLEVEEMSGDERVS